jgi:hypothetical protein
MSLDAERVRVELAYLSNRHDAFLRGGGAGRSRPAGPGPGGFLSSRLCGASHDEPVIEVGALAYVEQLPPILSLLRGVTVL